MDENDPIYKAIDLGGGQTCDIEGVVRELAKAGYIIRKVGEAGASPQDQALEVVRALAEARGANDGETIDRFVIRMLANMWIDAVRAEWQGFVDRDPELLAQLSVAKEMMLEDGYNGMDPICMTPGQKAFITKFENQEVVCLDHCMGQVMPLSAIYLNKVRLVQSAAARVAERLAKEAVKTPSEWPITIATGETFNSIEEMEKSTIHAVRETAKMMRDAEHYKSEPPSATPTIETSNYRWHKIPMPPLSCWQYFGFDGPVSYEELHVVYGGRIAGIQPTDKHELASEIGLQYQNCLREIGAAIMSGSETTERGSQ